MALGVLVIAVFLLLISCCCFWKMWVKVKLLNTRNVPRPIENPWIWLAVCWLPSNWTTSSMTWHYRGRRGGLMVRLIGWPDWGVWVRALAGDILLCSWERHLTLTVPLFTQVYKWVNGHRLPSHPGGSRNIPSRLMLQETGRSSGLMGHLGA